MYSTQLHTFKTSSM